MIGVLGKSHDKLQGTIPYLSRSPSTSFMKQLQWICLCTCNWVCWLCILLECTLLVFLHLWEGYRQYLLQKNDWKVMQLKLASGTGLSKETLLWASWSWMRFSPSCYFNLYISLPKMIKSVIDLSRWLMISNLGRPLKISIQRRTSYIGLKNKTQRAHLLVLPTNPRGSCLHIWIPLTWRKSRIQWYQEGCYKHM